MQTTLYISEKYTTLASQPVIDKTAAALRNNGMTVFVVDNGREARDMVRQIIPEKAEVLNAASVTLDTIGVTDDIVVSGKYHPARGRIASMDKTVQGREMRCLSAAPDWVVGSVQAITEDGQVIVSSATGSQLASYVFGAEHVIWVVGTQKIVRSYDEALNRINEYCWVMDDKRLKKAYGMPSIIGKILIINREELTARTTVILVKELLGY